MLGRTSFAEQTFWGLIALPTANGDQVPDGTGLAWLAFIAADPIHTKDRENERVVGASPNRTQQPGFHGHLSHVTPCASQKSAKVFRSPIQRSRPPILASTSASRSSRTLVVGWTRRTVGELLS